MTYLNQENLPKHIGIIVDGNRRWAKEKGLPTFAGHKKGAERIEEIVKYAIDLGIKIVTIYAFSTENWNRAKKEVSYLMKLFGALAKNKMDEANALGAQIRILGNFQRLPVSLKKY